MSGSRGNKRWFFDRIALLLNLITIIGLVASYLAGIVSPEKFWPFAFFAMAYPVFLAATLIFIIYWLFRRKWFLFLNIVLVLIKWDYVAATVKMPFGSSSEGPSGIKVMTYNVRLFDYYNWTNNKNTRHWTYDFLFNQQPNILCIQEFYHDRTGYFPTIDTLLEVNSIRHMHVENYTSKVDNKQLWGMATLTGYPILNKGRIDFPGTYGNLCIYSDVLIDGDTVRIYNLHLQSIRLGSDGYKAVDKILNAQELENVDEGKLLVSRMINGFLKRAEQAEVVADHIADCPYPIILGGDFNDVPTSYAYQTIAKGLEDSFTKSGKGLGNTYVRVPFFRIDNILYSSDFSSSNHTVHPYKLSDHLAVTAVLN